MLRQKVPFPEKWAIISVVIIAIAAAIAFSIMMYYHIYPTVFPGEKQPTVSSGGKFCYPWQTGCDNTAAIKLKQSSSYYTQISPPARP